MHARGLFLDAQAHFHGPGEGDDRDVRVLHQGVAHDRALARQEVEHAVGQPGLLEDARQAKADDRGQARGLVDHRVAADNGGGGHASADGQGEVPRPDDRGDALALVEVLVHLARGVAHAPGRAQAEHLAAVVLQEVDGLGHVGVGLVPLLAYLQHLQGREGVDVAAHDVRSLEEHLGALGRGHIAPGQEGLPGHVDGFAGLLQSGLADPAHDLRRVGRVVGVQGLGGAHLLAADDQRVGCAEVFAHLGQGLFHARPGRRDGEVHGGEVGEARQAAKAGRGPGRRGRGLAGLDLALGGQFRVFQQARQLRAFGKALAQEALVGGVFQQAAHQVGHARDEVAVGAVQAHAAGHVAQALAHGFGHAVQHLEFVAFRGHVQGGGHLLHGGDGADVVRGAGEVADVVVGQDHAGVALIGHVGLGLDGVHRHFPAVLLGQHGLGVPVGALDQADGDGQVFVPRPGDQPGHVGVGGLEVALEHDAQVRVVAVLRGAAQALEELDGDLLVLQLLHVDAQKAAHHLDLAVDGLHPAVDALDGACDIHGLGLGIEGRGLHGHVDLGRVAPVQFAARPLLDIKPVPFLDLGLDGVQHLHVARLVGVGLALVDRGLAQEVDDKGEAVLAQLADALDRLGGLFADDELAGHGLDVRADGLVQHHGHQAAAQAGLARAPLEHVRDVGVLVAEIFLNVPGQGLGGVEVGQHVDKAEHLDLEVLVLHGPVHDLARPPALVEDRRGLARDALEEFLAAQDDLLVQGLDFNAHSSAPWVFFIGSSWAAVSSGSMRVSLRVVRTTVVRVSRTPGMAPNCCRMCWRCSVSRARTLARYESCPAV